MKKLFLIVAVMAATVSANAQAEPGRFSIQPHTGGTGGIFSSAPKTSTIGLPSDFDTNVIAGNSIGVDFEYQINKWLSAAAGVNYVITGNAWKDKDVNKVLLRTQGTRPEDRCPVRLSHQCQGNVQHRGQDRQSHQDLHHVHRYQGRSQQVRYFHSRRYLL